MQQTKYVSVIDNKVACVWLLLVSSESLLKKKIFVSIFKCLLMLLQWRNLVQRLKVSFETHQKVRHDYRRPVTESTGFLKMTRVNFKNALHLYACVHDDEKWSKVNLLDDTSSVWIQKKIMTPAPEKLLARRYGPLCVVAEYGICNLHRGCRVRWCAPWLPWLPRLSPIFILAPLPRFPIFTIVP